MKKSIIYMLIGLSAAVSCTNDDSTSVFPDQNPNFSKIVITSPTEKLSVDYGQEFVFAPTVKQSIDSKSLQYIWTANSYNPLTNTLGTQFSCGEGAELRHAFTQMGTYRLRLEVKNEDYSEFKTWELSVRAYDEGIFVVGEDESGTANIAFGRSLSQTDVAEGKKFTFVSDLVAQVNPDVKLNNVIFINKSLINYSSLDAYLYIYTRDKIYVADVNTFKIFFTCNFTAKYPDEYIVAVGTNDNYGQNAVLFTSKGHLKYFKKTEFGVLDYSIFDGYSFTTCYLNRISTSGKNITNTEIGVDESKSKIYLNIPYYNSGGKPVSNTGSIVSGTYSEDVLTNEFTDYNILNVFQMNGDYFAATPRNFYVIAQDKTNARHVKIRDFSTTNTAGYVWGSTIEYTATEDITYKKGMEITANARYGMAYYASGSKMYVWYPTNVEPLNHFPTQATLDLGAGKEITTISVSYDMRKTYVGFYDSNATGSLKGGVYVYTSADIGIVTNLVPIEKYEGITTRPKQILFKSQKMDYWSSGD